MMQEIYTKIVPLEKAEDFRKSLTGKKVVFTNGCFDILHPGHISYLYQARQEGDLLWVGINSDKSVEKLKGPGRPVNNESSRSLLMASLFFVDLVTIFPHDTPVELIGLIRPDIHVKGGDYSPEKLPEYPVVRAYGGEVRILPYIEGNSTTGIIEKILKSK